MTFTLMLLAVVGFVTYHVTSPEQRTRAFEIAIEYFQHLKIAVIEPGPEYEAFRDALRARTLHLIVIPAIVLISAQLFLAMRFGSTAANEPAMLVGWGASLGTLTTNGGWWRLLTSTFVYTSMLHLLITVAVLIQVGRILERVVGRLTVTAVYLSAGIFTGLVNLSSHPLAVTVGTSGAVFGLYGLLIALLIWQTFHEWRGTWHAHTAAETPMPARPVEAEPRVLNTLQIQLDRPQLETWSPPVTADPPKVHVKAEAQLPPLDPSWGVVDETPAPAVETCRPTVAAPAVETWRPAIAGPTVEPWRPAIAGPAVETWEPAFDTSSPAIATWPTAAETEAAALAGPATTLPPVVLKRIGVGATVFLLYSAFSGFASTAEFTGLFVGVMYGLVLAYHAFDREPTRRHIGFATAAAAAVALVCAVALRNIADVKPEIARLLATEERTAAAYRTGFEAFKKGRMTADALAQLAEGNIIAQLQDVDARLKALTNVPPEHQPLVADAREYLRLRCASWRAHADVMRRTQYVPKRAPGEATDASYRLQAEARFRSNRAAAGSAEGAERASLQAFQRLKETPLP